MIAAQDQLPTERLPRLWPPIVLLVLFWAIYAVWRLTQLGAELGFLGFLIMMAVEGLVLLLFVGWWLAASRVRWSERVLVLATAVVAGIGAALLAHHLLGPVLLLQALPLMLTAWTLGVLVARKWPSRRRSLLLCGLVCLTWGVFLLFRGQGMGGDGQIALRWRWTLTPEEAYLAEGVPSATGAGKETLSLAPGDWPGFRGPNRDATLREVRIVTSWNSAPPRLVWKRHIGPAWSSVAVVGERVFTQEQLGGEEAVICLDAGSGRTLWSHRDPVRHEDVQGGAGPRATPTFNSGRIFALGATGILNCLDAATGQRRWSRNLATDAGTKVPMWGFSSSPLVVGERVIVFAGGDSEKTLLAYDVDSGQLAWSAPAGKVSYSSPQLASVGGETRLLFVSDGGLFAFEPSSGVLRWHFPTPPGGPAVPRAVQPRTLGDHRVLFDAGWDLGTALIEVAGGQKSPTERWVSRQIKPSFNDFVTLGSALYGFDGRILTCVDLETGRRRWKDGRYGSGQVLLLADQALLLVISDEGEVALVAANPDAYQEIARFQALEGKTWNHPVIALGRLYVRNAEEIACYEIQLEKSPN